MRKNISEIHHRRSHGGAAGFGTVTYRPRGKFGPRRQPAYQLVVIHRGDMAVSIDGREHRVEAGGGILLEPGREESFRFGERGETMHTWAQLAPDMVPKEMIFPAEALLKPRRCDAWLLEYMRTGWKIPADEESPASRQMLVSAVLAAIWAFCRAFPSQEAPPRPWPEPLVKVWRFMSERLGEPLSLDDLTKAGAVSKGHLVKLANEHWQTTPVERLWQERVEAGARLLRETGLGVAEIAYRTGFANPFHFSRRFRQRFGRHPRAWREFVWNSGGQTLG